MYRKKLLNQLYPLKGDASDYTPCLELTSNVDFVLIGESTHGTEEFYQIRAELTKRLITEQGFNAVAIEGDWPDSYRINRYIRGDCSIKDNLDSLEGFKRFPTWMWRNQIMLKFIDWLYHYNTTTKEMVGIYGLDLYSLNASIEIIISYLEKVDQEAAIRAKKRYACFEDFKEELDSYGFSTILGIRKSCEEAVIEQLNELNQNSDLYLNDNCLAEDEFFNIQQNAWLVKNAEQYYRSMFSTSSWNMRDSHMAATLDKLANYLGKKLGRPAKIIVWAHNSHIGDARATESAQEGQLNIGQLTREKYGNKVALIGLLTYSGTVTAASVWDGATERKFVRPALSNSYEHLFHHMNIPDFFLNIRDHNQHYLDKGLLERAIGVIYAPETERLSHYFYANLAKQFDAVIYLDNTTALKPLETTAIWHRGEVYETFPSGF